LTFGNDKRRKFNHLPSVDFLTSASVSSTDDFRTISASDIACNRGVGLDEIIRNYEWRQRNDWFAASLRILLLITLRLPKAHAALEDVGREAVSLWIKTLVKVK
jgi:hypothetical protein